MPTQASLTDTASPDASAPQSPPSPEPIMRLAAGFMAAKHLFAASELGLFEALGDGPTSLDGLAARTGLTTRAARISADAMVAIGLLERHGDRYQNSPAAAAFLAGTSPFDLRAFLRFWDKVSYPAWTQLADALAVGPSVEIFDLDPSLQQVASEGIEAITAGPAAALARTVDFSHHRRLLDIGGGTGSWSAAAVRHHRHLEATVFELPTVADLARTRLQGEFGPQIAVVAGDVMADELPKGHDVCLMANFIHYWSPEENRELLTRIRRAVGAGCRLLVADLWTDPSHTEPLMAALLAGATSSTATCTALRRWRRGYRPPAGSSPTTDPSPVPSASSLRRRVTGCDRGRPHDDPGISPPGPAWGQIRQGAPTFPAEQPDNDTRRCS